MTNTTATAPLPDLPDDYDQRIIVDASGLECPEPLMLLRKCIRETQNNQLIELISEDPVSLRDVPAFCNFMHHTLVSLPTNDHPHSFLVRKGKQDTAQS